MHKQKVLIFSTAYLPFVGGAEVAIKEITERLSSQFEFEIITAKLKTSLPYKEKVGNVLVHRLGIGVPIIDKLLLPLVGPAYVQLLKKRTPYSVFWVVMVSFSGGVAYIFNVFSKLFGGKNVPLVLTLQEGDSEEYFKSKWGGLVNISWRIALRRTDYLTAISSYLLGRAQRYGYSGKSTLIPNGVNFSAFSREYEGEVLQELKKELGKKEGDIFLITTSRLNIKNGLADVIKSLKYLPENVKFLILGTGELAGELEGLTRKLNLLERVKFVGFVAHSDIAKYLKISDIFVRPSLSEGMGNSFIEAMATGIPVIATPVGGIPDFLKNGETGLFSEVNNPQSIVVQVKKYLENPALREQVIIKAKKMVKEKYDWNLISKNMANVLMESGRSK